MGIGVGIAIGAAVGAATSYAKGKIAYEGAKKKASAYVRNGQLVIEKRFLTVKEAASHQKVSFLSGGLLLEGTPRAVINSTLVTGQKDILQQVSNINNRASNFIKQARHSAISGIVTGTISGAVSGALTAGAMSPAGGAVAGGASSSVGSAALETSVAATATAAISGTAIEGASILSMGSIASAMAPAASSLTFGQMSQIALMTAASSMKSMGSSSSNGGF